MKIYNKRGVHSYQEKKLENLIAEYFEKHPEKSEGYVAPSSYAELSAYYERNCIEDADIVSETKNEAKPDNHTSFRDSMDPEKTDEENILREDPMNRDEPKIREYVTDEGFQQEGPKDTKKSNYSEPTNFRDSFSTPDNATAGEKTIHDAQPLNSQPKAKTEAKTADPDAAIKKRSKKKFTKYAVDIVCDLAGRGIVWYTTKDITEEKIKEYIENGDLSQESLNFIVFLDANTRGTVKQFFQNRVESAQELANFSAEEKEDLVDALNDFLEYKKIEINPTINLIGIGLGMISGKVMSSMQSRAETGSILSQLKDMHAGMAASYQQTAPRNEVPKQEEAPAPQQNESETASEQENEAVSTELETIE